MHKSPTMLGAVALGALMALSTVGCKDPEIKAGRAKARTVKASIAEFDPNADVEFDMSMGGGGERPDEYQLSQSFNAAFGGMDQCVVAAKERRGMSADTILKGDVDLAVKLDPKKGKAAAVNATLPGKHAKDAALKDCIREAVAEIPFPKYDGPPVVAEFSCELDAGYFEDEEDW